MNEKIKKKSTYELFEIELKKTKQHRPLSVEWDLTYRCPCNCVHCFQKNYKSIGELPTDAIFDVIDQLQALGTKQYKLSGGDPLARTDIFDIIQYIKEKGAEVDIFTSGYFLTDEVCQKLADLDVKSVEVSLLGVDEETHDTLARCKGSFNRIYSGMKKLNELGVDHLCKFIHMRQNMHQVDKINSLATELGTKFFSNPYLWCQHEDEDSELDPYRITEEDKIEYFKLYPPKPVKKDILNCNAGQYMLAITPDGHVIPCGGFSRKYTVGNVSEESIKDIWEKSEMLIKMRNQIRYPIKKCRKCEASAFCTRCLAIASWADEDIDKPYEPMCKEAYFQKKVYDNEQSCE